MNIMEKNLPVAESLGSGDKVRIVTSGGNSKQIDASQIGGGGVFVVNIGYDDGTETYTIDKTYQEIVNAINGGSFIVCRQAFEEDGYYFSSNVSYSAGDNTVTFDFLYASVGTQQCDGQIQYLTLEEFLIDENDNLTYKYAKNTLCGGTQ